MNFKNERMTLIAAANEMNTSGINNGTSGNISMRVKEGMLITPSGMKYDCLIPADIVLMRRQGDLDSLRKPSSEWQIHRDIYANRSEFKAIVHCHSPYATALACLNRDIPAFHYMVAIGGGRDIRCASYATFGSQQLSENVVESLKGRKTCLMAHHGVISTGDCILNALALATEVEVLSQQYLLALSIGQPAILSAEEMDRVLLKFKNYGLNNKT